MRNDIENLAQIPGPLNIYSLILENDHLHFGYWPDDKPLMSLEEAQETMFEKLVAFMPRPPAKILDVGCGLGLSAALLASKGYHVWAIAPSEELIDYASQHYAQDGVDFWVADFMDQSLIEKIREEFDIVFFQESLQYLRPLDKVIENASVCLKAQGVFVLSDEVCRSRVLNDKTSVHCIHDIITELSEQKYKIKNLEEIGRNVQSTCSEIISRIDIFYDQILSSLRDASAQTQLDKLLIGWKDQKEWYRSKQFDYILLKAVKDNISMQAYSEGDEHNILKLFYQVFHHHRSLEHWMWKFVHNPFGQKKIALAKGADQEVAAHFSAYPVPVYCQIGPGEKSFLIAQAGDTMTHPAYRSYGLGKTSVLSRLARYFFAKFCVQKFPFIYGFNTGNIRKFGKRYLGYEYIRPIPYVVLNLKDVSMRRRFDYKKKALASVRQEENISPEFDSFFRRACTGYQMLIKRDAQYLKWRYFDCPDVDYHLFSIRKLGQIIGWAVFVLRDKRLIWGDGLFQKKHAQYVDYLLSYVLNHHFSDIESIEGWCSPHPDWWFQTLQDVGFQCIPEPNDLTPCFKIFDNQFTAQALDANFYYTLGDSDLF